MKERIFMGSKELKRLETLTRVQKSRLKRVKAAEILGISPRHFRRLYQTFQIEGPKAIVSKKVGARSNHRIAQEDRARILDFFKQEDHKDFGPTLAHEYLSENNSFDIWF